MDERRCFLYPIWILILTPSRVDAEVEQKIRRFVQFLWDCNFDVGQAVRTLKECLHEGRADISVATNY